MLLTTITSRKIIILAMLSFKLSLVHQLLLREESNRVYFLLTGFKASKRNLKLLN